MKLPPLSKDQEKEEEDLQAAFKAHKPNFTEKLAMGNDFETMLKDRSKNLIAVVNGLKMSVHLTVASSIFEMLKEARMVPPPAVDALEGLVSLTTDNTIQYRASLKEKKTIPSLKSEMEELAKNFKGNTPKEIRNKIKPVMEASQGLTKMLGSQFKLSSRTVLIR